MLKYIMTGAAFGLILAVVLHTWPKPADDYSFDGYDNAIYGGDIAYKQ